jgi:hypothetical protein
MPVTAPIAFLDLETGRDLDRYTKPRPACSAGCGRPAVTRGMCHPHYKRWLRCGTPGRAELALKGGPKRLCSLDDCERVVCARDWCSRHYQRYLAAGGLAEAVGRPPRAWDGRCRSCSGPGPFQKQTRLCNGCRADAKRAREAADPGGREARLARGRLYAAQVQARRRAKAIEAYGGRCVCCGESEPVFLALDHVKGDGKAHRATIGGGTPNMYRWAERNGYPPTLQLLCHNCNMAKSYNPGGCPHQIRRRVAA